MKRVVAEPDPGERDARVVAPARAGEPRPCSPEMVLALQRTAGNHAVARALARPQLARATHEKVFPNLGTYTVELKPGMDGVKYGQAITLTFQPLRPAGRQKKQEAK